MFTVTLLTSPATPVLEGTAAESLRNAWGGGELRWLDPGIAAEFAVPVIPENAEAVWADFQSLGIDMAFQKTEGRRKKLLIADMDSTMIRQECIDELADEAGVGAYVAAITARAMNGELDFEAALRERVGLLRDLPEAVIARVIKERITFMPGGSTLISTMKAHGAYTALVSGGFTAFTSVIAERLGFDENRANILLSADGKLTGEVAAPILGKEAKVIALEEISARLGLSPDKAIAVGDGANDIPMLLAAGTGVALHAKPRVQEQARLRINHGDLTALLYLQGYTREEFAA